MNKFDKRLDEILGQIKESSLLVKAENSITGSDVYGSPDIAVGRAKEAIRTLILEEVIGENERTNQMESPTWNYVGGQNALRAEQRQKVKGDNDE